MPTLPATRKRKTYRLFISHAWSYDAGYLRVAKMFVAAPRFFWHNYSAPSSKPVVDARTIIGKRRLRAELADQIRPVGCVVVVAGMYVAYREWIQVEIDIATGWGKPIVGIRPWGAARTPTAVSSVADEMVNWNSTSVVAAVRRQHL
jgi:MTH538 TIR-like domain (DUF1863)